jgi:hypothetical protein
MLRRCSRNDQQSTSQAIEPSKGYDWPCPLLPIPAQRALYRIKFFGIITLLEHAMSVGIGFRAGHGNSLLLLMYASFNS